MTAPGDITISILPSAQGYREAFIALLDDYVNHDSGLNAHPLDRLYLYRTDNRREGTTHIEITAHERTTPIEITDAATLELLQFVAQGQGKSVSELLRDAAKQAREE